MTRTHPSQPRTRSFIKHLSGFPRHIHNLRMLCRLMIWPSATIVPFFRHSVPPSHRPSNGPESSSRSVYAYPYNIKRSSLGYPHTLSPSPSVNPSNGLDPEIVPVDLIMT